MCLFRTVTLVVLGQAITWRHRKYGSLWDREGRVPVQADVFHFGTPMIVLGWYAFWMGINVTYGAPDNWYVPLYFTSRTVVAHVGAMLILITTWCTSAALDEAPVHENVCDAQAPAFGFEGVYFGEKREIRLGLTFPWVVFGVAAFLPYFDSLIPFVILLECLAVGVVLSMVQERGMRGGDRGELKRWILVADLTFALLVLLICAQGLYAAIFAVSGAILMNLGQYVLYRDRRRGFQWMETQKVNENPVVFSYGIPLFTLGLMLLAWGMSVPQSLF
jgi:uncharacterized membrane protein